MKTILILMFACLPVFAGAQKKKKQSLEEQVAVAKAQEQKAKEQSEKPLARPGARLPVFNVLTSKEKLFYDSSAAANKPLILALFNPGCDHCMTAARLFYDNLSRFRDATILFVTGNNLWGELGNFLKIAKMDLNNIENFVVAADHSNVLKDLFEYSGIPQVMIYNKDKILQKTFYQEVNVDSILLYMNK